jgi:hypothetical protein
MTSPTVTPPMAQPMNWVVPTGGRVEPERAVSPV